MVRLFLVFTYMWQEDVAIIPKVPGAPHNVYRVPGINYMVGTRNHLLYHFLITIHLQLAGFYAQNTFLKIIWGKCSLNKLLNFN